MQETSKKTEQAQNLYLIYIDESYDDTHFAYSALFVDVFRWNDYFSKILSWRKDWQEKHGFSLEHELHATNFVGGRGGQNTNRNKEFRAELFYEAIGRIEQIEGFSVINAITETKRLHLELFEWMLNRINTTLDRRNAIGILICDEGNEKEMTSLVRKMKKQNEIPSNQYHRAMYGPGSRNMPLNRIIEDPLFKTSESSYFIQLADFLAFALLRHEKPLPQTKEKVKTAFEQLDNVLIKQAFAKDPKGKGIVRK